MLKFGNQLSIGHMNNLFQLGNFSLASGEQSDWKIECDALTVEDWDALAIMLLDLLPVEFFAVYGVPKGGQPFAEALKPYRSSTAQRVLVVDDVWTTGQSMNDFIINQYPNLPIWRAVAFARGPVPFGVTPIFQMPVKEFLS
jgi:hypothetical protein